MIDVLTFLAPPFAACLVLVGILGYFGIHVLRRGVIFVDLALAQLVAFGTIVSFLFDNEPGSAGSFAFGLGAAVLGAAIFSWTRMRDGKVPQEALIGITYVVASSATILVADRLPEHADHVKELMSGAILWVTWGTVLRDFLVIAAVGALHYAARRRFILISEQPERAFAEGLRVRWWDFLFYLSFGLVITIAVEVAGVLMVFTYLVAPAIIAIASSDRWGRRIGIAWMLGAAASVLGLFASYRWDVPSGPAIVCSLGAFLLLFAALRRWLPGRGRIAAATTPDAVDA
jgi:zinc/manganese transport system permease protein